MLPVGVFILLSSAGIASSALVNRPSNVVALKGTRVELPCETTKASHKFQWTFTPIGGSEVTMYSVEIGVNEEHSGRITVNATTKSLNLIIDFTKMDDAGTYVCKVISTNGDSSVQRESGQLIVLDGDPACDTNLSSLFNAVTEGDFFQLYCNISYKAKWTPRMVCSQDGDNVTRLSEDASHGGSATQQRSVTNTVTYVAQRSKHNTRYSCRIFFTREPRVVVLANDNVSYYTRSWTSPRVNITYAPRELLISPEKQIYNPGERLTCSSNANPTPSLEWLELNTGRSVSGNLFPIKEYMTQEPISNLECIARNSVGTTRKKISFSVEKASSEPNISSSLTSIAVTVGGILALFFIVMLVMLIIYHMHIQRIVAVRKRLSNENNAIPQPSVDNYEDISAVDEVRDQLNADDTPVDSRDELENIEETYTAISETTYYDELTTRDPTVRTTYSNLDIERSSSVQLTESSHNNSMNSEQPELSCDESQRRHDYINVQNAVDQTYTTVINAH